ncbi:hypothetical protein GCM10027566_00880 [Arachidicoccus ginsenosidivorans]|jgi:hypothetical protein|uniref:hypothetical protein n=1 Tax=Arachidicoccus ginsenosidivorans TaxID=496057 RepID=UPI001315584E|nr:hypothetical protein [Arachidicoccus ginsenosidivorans]
MMKRCHVINKQEENYWAELYSAKLQGREEGREERNMEIAELLIENRGFFA